MSAGNGFRSILQMDGKGGSAAATVSTPAKSAPKWLHLDMTQPDARNWLESRTDIPAHIIHEMLNTHVTPRLEVVDQNMLLVLRGVNMNEGADASDMIPVVVWLSEKEIITLREQRLQSIDEIRNRLVSGNGPRNTGEFLVALVQQLIGRTDITLQKYDDRLELLEDDQLDTSTQNNPTEALGDLRRALIHIRRHLLPIRNALSQLHLQKLKWLPAATQRQVYELSILATRLVDDLESMRERATVLQEEWRASVADQTNARMYLLTTITGVFLPLSFITGVFGVNVGGMPGVDHPHAFWLMCSGMASLAFICILLLRWKRWL